MGQSFTTEDMLFHMLVVGGTGSGKTNAILYMLDFLHHRKKYEDREARPALFLFDPAGDASIDLLRAIPKSKWSLVTVLDPQYVSFGFNLLSLPEGLDPEDRPEILQAQVEEFSVLLSDVFNTDSTNAPRLMWIFKGALYYLYTFTDDPTFWELYNIMLSFTKKSVKEIEELLRSRNLEGEIIRETIEAISKLPPDAYMPVLNRISNFVLPPSSITFRTFCSRKSTIDPERQMEPGALTVFRIPSSLPGEFRRLFSASVVMKLYFASLKRAKRLERSGLPPTARTPVVLAADEFRDIAQMRILRTILAQSRKFGLYLWMVVQTLSEVPEELLGSIEANVGSILAFRGSPDDSRRLARLLHPQRAEAVETLIPGLEDYAAVVRKRPVGGEPVEPPFRIAFPKLREPVEEFRDALNYLKGEMEKKYGGAIGDRNLLYREDEEMAKKERGECPLGEPFYWVPLPYLHRLGPGKVAWFGELAEAFDDDYYGWSGSTLRASLGSLADSGWVWAKMGEKRIRDRDPETGQEIWREPQTNDEKMRAREAYYSLTPAAAKEFFELDLNRSRRPGGNMHGMMMKALLKDYWEKGYWCAWDRGDRGEMFPDILVTPPKTSLVKGKEGKQVVRIDPKKWDEERKMPVEVETDPAKNRSQVRINYEKDVARWGKVRFAVPTAYQDPVVRKILEDKDRTTLEVVVVDVGLPKDELEKQLAAEGVLVLPKSEDGGEEGAPPSAGGGGGAAGAEARVENQKPQEEPRLPSGISKGELKLLASILASGYTNKKALASKLGVSERTVTRYLVHLEGLGMLARQRKKYLLMQEGRNAVERGEIHHPSQTKPA